MDPFYFTLVQSTLFHSLTACTGQTPKFIFILWNAKKPNCSQYSRSSEKNLALIVICTGVDDVLRNDVGPVVVLWKNRIPFLMSKLWNTRDCFAIVNNLFITNIIMVSKVRAIYSRALCVYFHPPTG